MKKINQLVLMGAIALTGAVGFSSCSSEEEAVNNPFYNPETGEVETSFVFNVSTSNTPTVTRMSAYDTQANVTTASDFRGITNSNILTFKQMSGSALADGKSLATPLTAEKLYPFGTIIGANKLDPTYGDAATSVAKSHRVIELSLPTETNTIVFYGKAIKTGTSNQQGKITWNVEENLANTSFSMCKIVPETADADEPNIYQGALQQYEKLMARVLTEIVNSYVKQGTTIAFGSESLELTKDLSWTDYVKVSSDLQLSELKTSPLDPTNTKAISALGEILSKTFVTLNTFYDNELRAGAGEAVSYMMKDLMVNINKVINANPVSIYEVASQAVANAIKTNIEKYFNPEDNEYDWKLAGTVKDNCIALVASDKDKILDESDLNKFPMFFNLPSGSTILQFDIAKKDDNTGYTFTYNYKGAVETYAMGGSTTTNDSFDPKNYVYPAELCYFGNSPIRVSNDTKAPNDFPDGVADWDNGTKWTGWTSGSHVYSTTRSVAMQHNINYGTALLATTVHYGASKLQDNNANIQQQRLGVSEANNTIDVTGNDAHFHLTGILVGGQEPEVGWNYLAKSSSPGFGHMVYDNVGSVSIPKVEEGAVIGENSQTCYTLLWDNWQQSLKDQKQRDVYVALEFKNHSAGFWGENNFIRNGSVFYIVGKLDPDAGHSTTDRSEGITWPTNQALPPYDADGNTIKQRRVFIQDYMTTANFVIGEKSLQHALVAVPDLRSGQISLGLSVDLKWQTGLTFDNVILGE